MNNLFQVLMSFLTALPFKQKEMSQAIHKTFQPSMTNEQVDKYIDRISQPYDTEEKLYKLENIKDSSAEPAYYIQAPASDPGLEIIKKEVLGMSNLTSGAKQYFKNIPIAYEQLPTDVMGEAFPNPPDPYISINPKHNLSDPNEAKSLILHELLHLAPRILPNQINKSKIKEFTQEWGKEYMSEKGHMAEEQFAEQVLPRILYSHIFK